MKVGSGSFLPGKEFDERKATRVSSGSRCDCRYGEYELTVGGELS